MPNIHFDNYPLVSILIPCYNSEKYVSETLDSVLAQTYTNWECIIVDDHSTDNSVEIIKQYCSKHQKKFQLYSNPRKGACAARNIAFEHCLGDYIQYLDADDLLSDNKIMEQINCLTNLSSDFIVNARWGRFYQSPSDVKWEFQRIDRDFNKPYEWLIESWTGNGMAQTSNWLTPRWLIEQAGKWDETLLINQDGEFFCRVLLKAPGIKFCDQAKVYYRSGIENSVSKPNSEVKLKSQLHSFDLYYSHINQYQDIKILFKKALHSVYSDYYIRTYIEFPKLADEAKKRIKNLGYKRVKPQGGILFKTLCRVTGVNNAIKIREALKK